MNNKLTTHEVYPGNNESADDASHYFLMKRNKKQSMSRGGRESTKRVQSNATAVS